ncbi:single-stranded DNA-binding protein [Suttonella ornithocola]|uniref:single-stranded DNA-binding protein n=1 Tax=Suttonella ornithocola TaxID=279832 RepID=UPI000E1BE483
MNFSLATGSVWKNKSGVKNEKTTWHQCTAWRGLADIVEKYCKKGSRIFLSGYLDTNKYTDSESIERWTTKIIVDEILLLDKKED